MNDELSAISDISKLAVLNHLGIPPIKVKHDERFWAYFSKTQIESILRDFDSGILIVSARDLFAALQRTKDMIFESERAIRAQNGEKNASARR